MSRLLPAFRVSWPRLAVPFEVLAEIGGQEPPSLSYANMWQLTALEERVHLPARDGQERGRSINREQRFQRPLASRIYNGMGAHKRTVPQATPPKSAHNERVLFHDEDDRATLATRLARDDAFRRKVGAVAAAPTSERLTVAHREASSYAPNRGAHRECIVHLLLLGARGEWRIANRMVDLHTYLANDCRKAHWLDAELGPLDGRRVRRRSTTLEEAADYVLRFGAFRCINCGMTFSRAGRYEYAATSNRRSRRYHCDPCKEKLGMMVAESQKEAKKKILDVATGQQRRYRAARRAL
jgi:hypothetical protein